MQKNAFCSGLFTMRLMEAGNSRYATKTLLKMKLTIFLLSAAIVHVSAKGVSQTVSFNGKNSSLAEVFAVVKKQTGYTVAYNETVVNKAHPVTLNVKDLPLKDFLAQVFMGQPFDYFIRNTTIFISKKSAGNTDPVENSDLPAPFPIRGRVLSEDGSPLAGASVSIRNTKVSEVTNAEGVFNLKVSANDVLLISFVGFATREVPMTGMSTELTIVLKRNDNPLDKIQVIGYGVTSRRFSVGSATTVTSEVIERQPVNNVLLALQGQVPGLAVNATSGVPGARVQLQIRGQNTISTTGTGIKPYDQPFFIVDGVPFSQLNNRNINQLSGLTLSSNGFSGGISQQGGTSPFNTINPDDIESISILKDADATSIYGTQGANGVILITTKKGKAGKSSFNLTANTGISEAIRTLKLLNTEQYLQVRKDAFAADGIVPNVTSPYASGYAPDLLVFDQNKYTDWQKVVHGKTVNNVDVHATLSGGTLNNTFLISVGYNRAEVNFPGNYATEGFSVHSNVHHSSANNRFTADFITDFGYSFNNSPGYGGAQKAFLPPNLPDLLDANGNLNWSYKGVNLQSYQFYGYLKNSADLRNYNYNNSLRLSYKLLPGLNIGGMVGYNRNTVGEHGENPGTSYPPTAPYRSAIFANSQAETIIVEPQLDYTWASGKGILNVLVGGTYKKNTSSSTYITASGYANDNFLGTTDGATDVYVGNGSDIYKYGAGFASIRYVYDQRYIVSLTGRRDGSSYFGPGNKFGNFGSAGLGWIFSEEKAFRSALPFVSYAKISANYGSSGSDGIASYRYQAFWQPRSDIPAFQGIQPTAPVNLYNPNYSWALKKTLNASLDIGVLKDRLLLNATFYQSREGNQLGTFPLPNQVGLTNVTENMAANVQNQGWEFTLNSTNIKTSDFNWTTSFNISFNRNKLLAFPNLEASPYNGQYVVGRPTSVAYVYRFKGLNAETGLYEYYSKDNKVINRPKFGPAFTGGDQAPLVDGEVKFMGGLGNTLSYKGLNLHFFFQFSKQTAPNYLSNFYGGTFNPGFSMTNIPVQGLDYWKKPGDHTTLQKLTTGYSSPVAQVSNIAQSTGGYSTYGYARLKTVSLSYNLPDAWLKKIHVQGLRVYANAQNLLTITDYKVTDPELFSNFAAMPIQRIIVFGLNLNL